MNWVDGLNTADEIVNFLIHNTPDKTTDASCHDALLVFDFFPQLGEDFQTCPDIQEEQVEHFKETFDYTSVGLDPEVARSRIKNFRSIGRILDMLVMLMPSDFKQQLMKKYLLEIWLSQNSGGDLQHFKQSLDRDFWLDK